MVKVYGTDAVEYVESKLGFVEEFAHGDVEVRIKETKASELWVASILYRLKGHPDVNISSGEHSQVAKCVNELADKVSVKVSREKDKYDSRRRKSRLKEEKALAEELEIDIEGIDFSDGLLPDEGIPDTDEDVFFEV